MTKSSDSVPYPKSIVRYYCIKFVLLIFKLKCNGSSVGYQWNMKHVKMVKIPGHQKFNIISTFPSDHILLRSECETIVIFGWRLFVISGLWTRDVTLSTPFSSSMASTQGILEPSTNTCLTSPHFSDPVLFRICWVICSSNSNKWGFRLCIPNINPSLQIKIDYENFIATWFYL